LTLLDALNQNYLKARGFVRLASKTLLYLHCDYMPSIITGLQRVTTEITSTLMVQAVLWRTPFFHPKGTSILMMTSRSLNRRLVAWICFGLHCMSLVIL